VRKIILILTFIALAAVSYRFLVRSSEDSRCAISLVEEGYGEAKIHSGWCLNELSSIYISCKRKDEIVGKVSRAPRELDRLPVGDYKAIYIVGEFAIAFFDEDSGAYLWRVEVEWHDGRNTYFPIERLGMLNEDIATEVFELVDLSNNDRQALE
jgi:hypothetical protein